jgi:gamma-glutamylcyclotransferase (GGCT)/AIG2-like uncharacterized protein YtfP
VKKGDERVFVYGTLKQGNWNHAMLGKNARLVMPCTLPDLELRVFPGSRLPIAVPKAGIYPHLRGELYYISKKAFKAIDSMEKGAGYRRVMLTPIAMGNGVRSSMGPAHVWIMHPLDKNLTTVSVPLGDYTVDAVEEAISDWSE